DDSAMVIRNPQTPGDRAGLHRYRGVIPDGAEGALLVLGDDDLGVADLADVVAAQGRDVHHDGVGGAVVVEAVGRGGGLGLVGRRSGRVGPGGEPVVGVEVAGRGQGWGVGGGLGGAAVVEE